MRKSAKIIVLVLVVVAVIAAIAARPGHRGESLPPDDSGLTSAEPNFKNGLPKIVDIGAEQCIPCKAMVPVLESLRSEYKGKLDVIFIDVWENPGELEKYGVKLIPTQILFGTDGKELLRHQGFFSKEEIIEAFAKSGVKL